VQLADQLDRRQLDQPAQRLRLAFRLAQAHAEAHAELVVRRIGIGAPAGLQDHDRIARGDAGQDRQVVRGEYAQVQPQDRRGRIPRDAEVEEGLEAEAGVLLVADHVLVELRDRALDVELRQHFIGARALCRREEADDIGGVAAEGDHAQGAAAPGHVGQRADQHVAGAGVDLLGLVKDVLHQRRDVAHAVVDHQVVHAAQRAGEAGDGAEGRHLWALAHHPGLLDRLLLHLHRAATGEQAGQRDGGHAQVA